jgi:NADP-dependent 3-hydroxy acid dehydrogenase YdfG
VVIGAGGGIGRAVACAFAQQGYRLALLDHHADRLTESARQLPAGSIHAEWVVDITRPEEIGPAVEALQGCFGRVDTLVHAAGLTQVSPATTTSLEVYRRVMEVNFFGVVAITQALLPAVTRAQGEIIVLSSICGIAPLIGRTGYCASKHALHGYFETLRAELRPSGTRVMLVCPSFVDTEFATRGLAGDGTLLPFDRSTLGQPTSADHIARAIVRGANRRRRLLLFSWRGWLTYYLTRLAPSLYDRLMSQHFEVEMRRPKGSIPSGEGRQSK